MVQSNLLMVLNWSQLKKTKYLGGIITRRAIRESELTNRLGVALATANKLKTFWRKTNASLAWKLQIYNAIIVSQLLYGMNTIHLTNSMQRKLDAFQIKGLRYIMKIEHSFWSHATNTFIIEKANILANKGNQWELTWEQFLQVKTDAKLKIKKLSVIVKDRASY